MVDESLAEKSNATVSAMECAAMRLLAEEYSRADLSRIFMVSDGTVNKHVNGHCKVHAEPDSVSDEEKLRRLNDNE